MLMAELATPRPRHSARSRSWIIGALALSLALSSSPTPPAAGAARAHARLVKARQKFFGAKNVDPRTGRVRSDRVIFSWLGVATYAVAINGHVILLDAWVPRGSHSGYVPTNKSEIAAADPEYIFIGHGDFDHAADAASIASAANAKIVGTPEHCSMIRNQPEAKGKIHCLRVAPPGAPPGYLRRLSGLIPRVDISAVVHIHSSVERPEFSDGGRLPCPPIWNARNTLDHPPTPEDMEHLFRHLGDARGGNVLYQFKVGRFAFAWHDTTGKISEDARQVITVLEHLPRTDLHFGSVLAFGQATNCMRSLGAYIRALGPKIYTPNHHDNFTFLIGANARDLEPYVREEIGRIPRKKRPRIRYTYDRRDYIEPDLLTFNPAAKAWK
jgi:hypothetical protein